MKSFCLFFIGFFFALLSLILLGTIYKADQTKILDTIKEGKAPILIEFKETIQTPCPDFLISDKQKKYCSENKEKKCHQYCLDLPHCCIIGTNPELKH